MNKFETTKRKMEVLSDIYESLENNYKMNLEWSNEENSAYNEMYKMNAEVYLEVMNLLEKHYLK